MTCCLAVSETAVVVCSIDKDTCHAYSMNDGSVTDLTRCLGEAYRNMAINDRDLQRACAAFSADGRLFAYNPNKGKLLSTWNTADWSLAGNRTLAKHATKIVFTPKSDVIVVGDKKGDVYAFEELPARVLGHSSMILDICFSRDEKFIVTCDSDEKVRVSYYPNGKNIIHYLMGHTAYVSGICVLNDSFILSGSGDRTLRLWDFNNGELLGQLALPTPVQNVVDMGNVAAIHSLNSDEVHFVKAEKVENNNWRIKLIKTIKFNGNIVDLAAHRDQLWVIAERSIHMCVVSSSDELITISKDENYEETQMCRTLNNLMEDFVHFENTNLMIFLHKKMIDKQKRIEQYNNSMSSDTSLLIHDSKRIKIATK